MFSKTIITTTAVGLLGLATVVTPGLAQERHGAGGGGGARGGPAIGGGQAIGGAAGGGGMMRAAPSGGATVGAAPNTRTGPERGGGAISGGRISTGPVVGGGPTGQQWSGGWRHHHRFRHGRAFVYGFGYPVYGYGYPDYAYDDYYEYPYEYGSCFELRRVWWHGRWHWRRVNVCY